MQKIGIKILHCI